MNTFIVFLSVRCCSTTSLYFIFLGFSCFDFIHYSRSISCLYYLYKYVIKECRYLFIPNENPNSNHATLMLQNSYKMIHAVKTHSFISSSRSKKFIILPSHYLILLSLLVNFYFHPVFVYPDVRKYCS